MIYSSDDEEFRLGHRLEDIERDEQLEDEQRLLETPPMYDPEVDGHRVLFLTKATMRKYQFATVRDNEQILYFHPEHRYYVPGGQRMIKEYCQMVYESVKDVEVESVINQISRRTGVDRSALDSDTECVTFANCYLNVLTGEVYKRSPSHHATIRIPHRHNPKARCPKIAKFLSQVLRPNDIQLALQFIGYCLLKGPPKYKKALMCTGKGDNGKSVFLELIERLLGVDNCSAVPLQELCGGSGQRFAAVGLKGKLANIYADLPSDKLEDTGTFKMLVSGDRIKIEKKHIDHTYFKNNAKLIFSANKIPPSPDDDPAFINRWIVFVFEGFFDINSRNVNQIDELTSNEEEMSGLLNLALISLRQLVKDGGFIHAPNLEETKDLYNRHSDTVRSFIYNKCDVHRKISSKEKLPSTSCERLYDKYHEYCCNENEEGLNIKAFGSEIAALHIDKGRRGSKSFQEWHYIGVTLKEEFEPQAERSESTLF